MVLEYRHLFLALHFQHSFFFIFHNLLLLLTSTPLLLVRPIIVLLHRPPFDRSELLLIKYCIVLVASWIHLEFHL